MGIKIYKEPEFSVVLQEVPGEVSIGFQVASCKQNCPNCSYKSLVKFGTDILTLPRFEQILNDNKGLASCVLFMGGEEEQELSEFLQRAKSLGYKTCMYTGMKNIGDIRPEVIDGLDYIKVGRWEGKSIKDKDTNQKFYTLPEQKDITASFQKN